MGGGLDVVGSDGVHQRPGRAQPGPGHRRWGATFGQHGDDRLTDAQRREIGCQVVELGLGIGTHRLGQRLLIIGGECPQCVLDASTELGEHGVGHIGGQLGAKEHPHALGTNQLHRLLHLRQERLGRVGE